MTLEEIRRRFENTSTPDDEVQDLLQERFEELLEQNSRTEILDSLKDFGAEFREFARETLDQEVFREYRDQLDLDETFDEQFEDTIEDLARLFSREKVLEMARERSEEFEEKVRDVLG